MFRKIIKGLKDVWCGTLEFDTEPKKDSFNPVTSGGVYDAINGAGGAKEIVYFDVDPSDPPSGIHTAIGEALSNNKLPVLKIDGAVYFYTATGTDKYVFVGGYTKEAVGYTEIEVSDDDSVTSKSVDDKVFNMYMLYRTDPASPGDPPGTEDYWICDENKHVITKAELLAAHADCRYFILNNAVEPDSNSRKYFASVTDISNSYVRLRFYMMQYDAQGVAEFYQKTVMADSEGRLYILSSYSATLAGVNQAVLVSEPQNFDATQKAQGRANIGAASASDVTALQSQVSSLSDVSAYSVKGEATVAQLNAGPSGIQAGWAYQLTDSGTLTDGSLAVVAGDTVAWDGTKWFPLVRSDYYATKTYAQNVAHSIAPEFDPTRTSENPYKAGETVTYTDGKVYTFKVDHYGAWSANDVKPTNIYDEILLSSLSGKYEKVNDFEFISGFRVNSNTGYLHESLMWKASFYLDVGGCDKIVFTAATYTSDTTTGIAFYNKNRRYISGVTYRVSESLGYEWVEVPVPSEAVFVRVSAYDSDSVDGQFALFKGKKSGVLLDTTSDVVFDDGYRIDSLTGERPSSGTWAASDYISVDGVSRIDIAVPAYSSSSTTGLAFYNEYKEFIASSGVSVFVNMQDAGYHIGSFKVPADAKYMRCSRYNNETEASLSKKFSLKFEVLDTKFFKITEGSDSDDSGDESVIDDISLGTKASLAICCSRDTIEDNRTPYSFGFLGCLLFKNDPWLWYGSSIDNMKKFVKLNGVYPERMNVAMSPSSNIVIVAKQFERDKLIVVKDGAQIEIPTIEGTAPMGWLYNSGLTFFNDSDNVEHCIFAEYTKNHPVDGGKFYVYKGTYPYDSQSLWKKVFSYDESENNVDGYIIHFHQVTRDPWTGILYLTSGDYDNQLHWWYSTDEGESWTELVNIHSAGYDWGSQVLRLVNFAFTQDYIYFAVDNENNHCLNRLSRDSVTGVIDISSRTKLCDLPANQATNSICFVERPYGIFGYDRTQNSPVYCWFFDLNTNELKTLFIMPTRPGSYPPTGNRGAFYLHYSSVRTPNPIIGFNRRFYCLFELNSKISGEIGSLVYNVATGQVSDISI